MTKPQKKPVFNKKNVLAFADAIYSERNGRVSFLKLCANGLIEHQGRKSVLHCAIGEAYVQFIDSNVGVLNRRNGYYSSKYSACDGPTASAIDTLVDKAQLKNSSPQLKLKLAEALDNITGVNDVVRDLDEYDRAIYDSFLVRAERVAQAFRKTVAPLLK